ncbi:MAG: bifunctional pyr operon transcriptional regulator/uracil phosphoribosyltransferase PyrR [Acholeplasmataceae bacterium]
MISLKEILSDIQVKKTLTRISHEIIERHNALDNIVLVGILTKGLPIAEIISENIHKFSGHALPAFGIDISAYRDDEKKASEAFMLKAELKDKEVILVDDVLFTGRSVRAAMDAVMDLGRAKSIELAVLVDRGHRELPIRADYVGKNIPTHKLDKIYYDSEKHIVYLKETR